VQIIGYINTDNNVFTHGIIIIIIIIIIITITIIYHWCVYH